MAHGLTVYLSGEHSATTAQAIKSRLTEAGRRAEIIDEHLAQRIGCPASRTLACEVLMRNGVAVLVTTDSVRPPAHGAVVHSFDTDRSAAHAVEQAVAIVMNGVNGNAPHTTPRAATKSMPRTLDLVGYAK